MAWAITLAGSNQLTANAGTVSVTGVTIPAGSLILITIFSNDDFGSVTISDGGVNTYTRILTESGTSSQLLSVYYVFNSVALSGATVSYVSSHTGDMKSIQVIYITGNDTTAPLDTSVTATTTGSSAAPSVTSGTPAVAGELFIAIFGNTAGNKTFTQAASWSAPPNNVRNASSLSNQAGGNQVNATTGTLTYAPTLNSSDTWFAGVVGFKPAPTFVPYIQPDDNTADIARARRMYRNVPN